MPGRIELTVKFSEWPSPLQVQGGMKIGIQTDAGIVTAILPLKTWRKLEQKTQGSTAWVVTLNGSLERFTNGEIVLKHPAVQFFEKKIKPEAEAPADTSAEKPKAPAASGPIAKTAQESSPASKTPDAPAASPAYPAPSLNPRGAAKT
ncbi:MAG: hypothetical protein H6976_11280 [Gammaproteobacteria bacterium]|nr:hypothetical protein [Gammaproteobacteria bacterium]